ncbi:MAG: hypothetical protein KGL15_10975 [Acidobacteriota bacterium]|nr:hypothetical protein [Acidobacteriota bacterium]
MNDDWRVQVTCATNAAAADLGERLREGEFQHDMQDAAGERVAVSVDDHELFLYAGTRAQAERAAAAVGSLAASSGVTVRSELRRWHPVSEEWVDADLPLPEGERALGAEHAELIEQEDEEQAHLRYAAWEVRASTKSVRETAELVKKLRQEGIPSLRRWHFLLIGAADEDAAKALAERVRALAPADVVVNVEGSYDEALAKGPANPFAVFGGLGG